MIITMTMSPAYSISPLVGSFITLPLMSVEIAIMSRDVPEGFTRDHNGEFKFNMGVHFYLSYLQETYVLMVEHYICKEAANVYLSHLAGCTILAYKSHVYIDARYTGLFIDL